MKDFSTSSMPKSKAGQLADLLRARLRDGYWKESLPSERALADEYLVSRTTVRQALDYLKVDGWIEGCASTRDRRRVLVQGRHGPRQPTSGRVVFLTPSMSDSPLILGQLAVLRELLGGAGFRVLVKDQSRLATLRNPLPSIQRLLGEHPDAVWVLHKMSRRVHEAFASAGVPTVVFGSSFPGIRLPAIDVDFRAVARHAAGRCLGAGYQRLAVIVHRTPLAGDEGIVEAISEELTNRQAPPPRVMKHDFNRARLIDALDRDIVPQGTRPDVLLIVNQHHLLTTLPHLLWRGVRIPQEMCLIYLNNDPAAERLSPLPERYDLGDRLLRRLATAILSCFAGEIPKSARLLPVAARGSTFDVSRAGTGNPAGSL
jgi:DNA-binding LacI/PurR family transcriptional regulator